MIFGITRLGRPITYEKYGRIEMKDLPEAPFVWEYSPETGALFLAIRVYDSRWKTYETQEFFYRPHPKWHSHPFNQTVGALSNHPLFGLNCRDRVYDNECLRAFTILLQGKRYAGWKGAEDDGRGLFLAKAPLPQRKVTSEEKSPKIYGSIVG